MNKISLIILISIGAMALKKVKNVSFTSSQTSSSPRNKLLVFSDKPISLDPVHSCQIYMGQDSSMSDEHPEQGLGEGSWDLTFAICSDSNCYNYCMTCAPSDSSLSFVVDSRLKPHDPMALQSRDFEDVDLGVKDKDGLEVHMDHVKCQYTLEYVNLM